MALTPDTALAPLHQTSQASPCFQDVCRSVGGNLMENVLAIDVFVQPHPPLSHPARANVFISSLYDLFSGPARQRRPVAELSHACENNNNINGLDLYSAFIGTQSTSH